MIGSSLGSSVMRYSLGSSLGSLVIESSLDSSVTGFSLEFSGYRILFRILSDRVPLSALGPWIIFRVFSPRFPVCRLLSDASRT